MAKERQDFQGNVLIQGSLEVLGRINDHEISRIATATQTSDIVTEFLLTLDDYLNGFDQDDGVTTPEAPLWEGDGVVVGGQHITLIWKPQTKVNGYSGTLTSFYCYEIQASADSDGSPDGNWYSLRFDGVD